VAGLRGRDGSSALPLQAFVVPLGHEPALQVELPGRLAGPRWPGLLTSRDQLPLVDPAFALQQLPGAYWVRGDSLAAVARAAAAQVAPLLAATETPWLLHTFVPDPEAYRTLSPLVGSLWEAFLSELRRIAPAVVSRQAPADARFGDDPLVQLALVGKTALLVSCARPRALPWGGLDLAPWPGGRAPVPSDRRAPSRAYRKLVEGFAWLGAAPGPGERCVDLGGSPGGWAWTALARGASVVAVDRSPLEPPAAGHHALKAIVGDAFAYRPQEPADWLLCDVICRPERTIELAESWMREGLCRRLVATLKFTGTGDYAAIERARQRLQLPGWRFLRLKHMAHHHNEVAILARRA
jgi:23S rRNA (cytidine2498-2'-O)-methyltransferase